jgi:hypothetical protein
MIDLVVVDRRYFDKESYKRKREAAFVMTAAEQRVSQDKDYYRIFNVQGDAVASYFFNSLTGYHGAKLRRYDDLLEKGIYTDLQTYFQDAQQQTIDFSKYGVINMLNCKYIIFGENANEVLVNYGTGGPAWFIKELNEVSSPKDELDKTLEIDTRTAAVIDVTKFKAPPVAFDSTSIIKVIENKPNYLKYEAESATTNVGVFSEIYYPKGWIAFIDGKETEIFRVNYILRALQIPQGKHTIEFKFEPKPYMIGNKITLASSWIAFLFLLGSIGWVVFKED